MAEYKRDWRSPLELIDYHSVQGAHARLNDAFKEIQKLENEIKAIKATNYFLYAALGIVVVKMWLSA